MYFEHIYDKTLAQASYFIGCQAKGEAIVIDAKRDIDTYLEIARQQKMKITHVTETHIHADFLAGTRELAKVTGAKMYLSDEGGPDWQYEFDHVGLRDGDVITVGNLTLKVMHTPGHTPESISFLLTDHPGSEDPIMVFTGDFVFVGDIGRPDLLEKAAGLKGTQDEGARQMYKSLERFAALPPYVQVWPGHGAGSACGKALGAVPVSTVGYETGRNWAFRFGQDEPGFVATLLTDQPEPPRYFAMMKKLNKVDRPLLTEVPVYPELSPADFRKAYESGVTIVDTRDKKEFAQNHLPGSLNIQGNNSFATWCGWVLDYDKPFILVADPAKMEDLTRKLMRIGLDNVMGFISDPEAIEIPMQGSTIIDDFALKALIGDSHIQILDVRNATEYKAGHVEGAKHLFVGTLEQNLDKIEPGKQIALYCQAGDRAAIGQSLLQKHGYKNVLNYSAGMSEWKKLGHETTTD